MCGGAEKASDRRMGSISSLTTSYLNSIGSSFLASNSGVNANGTDPLSTLQPDSGALSPFAQMMSDLQQLQQSDPDKYKQVTQQIADKLQSAAQEAAQDGDNAAAAKLNQLSSDFSKASSTGQLPDVKDLAKGIGGGHGHHRTHAPQAGSDNR